MPDAPHTPPHPAHAPQGTPALSPTVPTDAMTVAQRDALVTRLQAAWNSLPAATQAALRPALDDGHNQFASWINGGPAPTHHTQMTLRVKSYLQNDYEGLLAQAGHPVNLGVTHPLAAPVPEQAIEIATSPDGSILGTGPYQQLDLRWELLAGTVWLEHLLFKHPFPPGAPDSTEPIPDNISIALISDWGTGNFGAGDAPAVKISKFVPKLAPDYSIHLGDVYYAGLSEEETDNFLTYWPKGSAASFALNSNHDMYSGGGPFFDEVVGGPIFNKLQSPWSFFALENPHWIILGLDSAYFSSAIGLYLNGTLGENNTQTAFARKVAQHAAAVGKKVIVLTHHNPISISGLEPDPKDHLQLHNDLKTAFDGCPPPAYWYFGHEHVGTAYNGAANGGTLYRCIGHGGLPWGQSSDLANAKAAGKLDWYENCLAGDPNDTLRVYNGFVLLNLNGPNLTETFYDELGRVAFRPGTKDNRC